MDARLFQCAAFVPSQKKVIKDVTTVVARDEGGARTRFIQENLCDLPEGVDIEDVEVTVVPFGR